MKMLLKNNHVEVHLLLTITICRLVEFKGLGLPKIQLVSAPKYFLGTTALISLKKKKKKKKKKKNQSLYSMQRSQKAVGPSGYFFHRPSTRRVEGLCFFTTAYTDDTSCPN